MIHNPGLAAFLKRATKAVLRLCRIFKKVPTKRILLFLLVAIIVYGASGVIIVPPNSRVYISVQPTANYTIMLPYVFTSGVWWVNPSLQREEQFSIRDWPTVDDFLAMAWYYDTELDALIAKGQLHNPRNDAEVEAMAETIVAYLRTMEGPFYNDFQFNGVSCFTPNPATPSKYDVEIAHWARIKTDEHHVALKEDGWYVPDNSIYVNRTYYLKMLRENTDSFFGLLTHEIGHGALSFTLPPSAEGYWDQETLNQVVTAQALYGMAQQRIPGAAAAFMEHMRDLALFSAKYMAYFADDIMIPHYYGNLVIGSLINMRASETDTFPTVWESPGAVIITQDYAKTAAEVLKGNFYGTGSRVNEDPFPVMDWIKQRLLLIRQNGIHIRPYTMLRDAIGYHKWWANLGRGIFGPEFAYWEWVPLTGEKERFDAIQTAIFGRGPSDEFQEKWKYNNAYFADAWFRYSYGPMMTILGNVNYGIPIRWYGTQTSDVNEMLYYAMRGWADFIFAPRSISFDAGTWDGLLSPLALDRHALPDTGKCLRTVSGGPCIAVSEKAWSYGTWRPFPRIPILFGLFLILDGLVVRKFSTRRRCVKQTAVCLSPILYGPVEFAGRRVVRAAQRLKRWRKANK